MIRAGVVGWPAKHSLSPMIHRAWLDAAGIEGEYEIYERKDFGAFLDEARAHGLKGVNVTAPFKENAFDAATIRMPEAKAAGAANVLVFQEGGQILCQNTDGLGVLNALNLADWATPRTYVILGAGGAAAGAVMALHHQTGQNPKGPSYIRFVNRTAEKGRALAARFDDRVQSYGWDDLPEALAGAHVLINATSLGLNGDNPLGMAFDGLKPDALVMDMVYRPLETAFLKSAKAAGYKTVDGLDMLIGQAKPSFEFFFGQWPRLDVDVRALCRAELERRGG